MPLDPQIAALAEAMAATPDAKPTHEQTPKAARDAYRALGGAFGSGPEVANVEDRKISTPVGQIPVRVYRPEGDGPFGVFVFYHGGGWVIGDLDTHDRECRTLCIGAHCVVVAVDYRRAPEHPFPAAVEDAFEALRWVGKHAAELGGDRKRIAVGGDSAGGNLAAVVALLARDGGGPALRFQLLVYPAVDARQGVEYRSRERNAAGPFLLIQTMEYFLAHYLKGCPDSARQDPRLSPIAAASHRGLPPALVVTAEYDLLRDEGEAYARALEKAGVPVTLHRYDGMAHLFFQLSALVEQSAKLLDESSAALRAALA